MRSPPKPSPPQMPRGLARLLVIRALRGEKPSIRRLQAALAPAGKPISPEPLEVTLLWFGDEPPASTVAFPIPAPAPQPRHAAAGKQSGPGRLIRPGPDSAGTPSPRPWPR